MIDSEHLAKALTDLDSTYLATRLAAIQILADAKHPPALVRLVAMVRDQNRDEKTRAAAVRGLGKWGSASALPAFIDVLREVKPAAIEEPPPEGTPETVSLTGVLLSAAVPVALRAIGTPEALKALEQWQRGEDISDIIVETPAAVEPVVEKISESAVASSPTGEEKVAEYTETLADYIEKNGYDDQEKTAAEEDVSAVNTALQTFIERLKTASDPDVILAETMDTIVKLTGAERGFIVLKNAKTGAYDDFHAFHGLDASEVKTAQEFQISRTIVNEVAKTQQPVLTDNAAQDARYANVESIAAFSLRSIMAVPLKVGDNIVGIFYGDNRFMSGVFKTDDLKSVAEFADQAAAAIQATRSIIISTVEREEAQVPEPNDQFGTTEPFAPPAPQPSEPPKPQPPLMPQPASPAPVTPESLAPAASGKPQPPPVALPAAPPRIEPPAEQTAIPPRSREIPEAPRGGSEPAKPPASASPVQFSAYTPKILKPDDWQSLYAYVFREQVASTVVADAFEQLGKKQAGYSAVTQPARTAIVEGAQITATPHIAGFQFNPVSVTIGFYDDWARFDFRLRAKDAPISQFATGTITFTIEGIIIADVPLSVY
ncbi:MAG: GAF domain-containing protein, partial [Chitinophagaceae bacterium]|nr:GAF domain-containing protein [Anaerolineae bacterium]